VLFQTPSHRGISIGKMSQGAMSETSERLWGRQKLCLRQTGHALFAMRVQGDHIPTNTESHRAAPSKDLPMAQKTIATLLILFAFALAGANSASAEAGGIRGGGLHEKGGDSFHGGGFRGRGFHRRNSPLVVGGFVTDYGFVGSGGYTDNNGPGYGIGDWYGISSGHDACPLFRKRVLTPEGWQVQMVPVC